MSKNFNSGNLLPKFVIVLLLACPLINFAQVFPNGEFIIGNYTADNVLDVKSGSTDPKAQIWLYKLNQKNSQYFRFESVGSPNDKIFTIRNVNSNLYLTAKMVLLVDMSPASPSASGNYAISQEKLYPLNTKPDISTTTIDAKNQYWQLVSGVDASHQNVYVLKNIRFTNQVLKKASNEVNAYLTLASYVPGRKDQMWQIRSLPKIPQISRVEYAYNAQNNRISGTIYWTDNSNNESGFRIWTERRDGTAPYSSFEIANSLPANKTSYSFTFDESNSARGKNKEHCFYVMALGNDFNSLPSKYYCKVATVNPAPPPPPPPPPAAGVSSIYAYNCHSEGKDVIWWTYDLTINNGVWVKRGTSGSHWVGSSCPVGLPFIFPLADGHSYIVKAIDCGSNPPNTTPGSCHKLTTINPILGKAGGSNLILTVQ